MKIKLTDKQIVLAGWDTRRGQPVRNGRVFEVDSDDLAELRMIAETLCFGADPDTTRTAKALLHKLDKLE